MQHGYKTQHSTVMAQHTLNNTIAKEFNKMAPPVLTITVALDMSKASFYLRRRFIEISKILYRIVENKDIREYNMIETKAGARVNIDC